MHGLFLRSARENHARVAMQMMAPFTPRSMTYGQVLWTQASLGFESRPLCTLHAHTRICTQRTARRQVPGPESRHAVRDPRKRAQTCELGMPATNANAPAHMRCRVRAADLQVRGAATAAARVLRARGVGPGCTVGTSVDEGSLMILTQVCVCVCACVRACVRARACVLRRDC